jgi:hypothetical protein
MTKPYKATQNWVDMYDVRHTLFLYQIYKYFFTNYQMDFYIKNKKTSLFREVFVNYLIAI